MKRIAILQSNYIPWKGYFDLINMADEFVIFDEVQYTKNDWRNRNKIKVPGGTSWITIPVAADIKKTISQTKTINDRWRSKHWKTIVQNYAKSKYFVEYKDQFEEVYLNVDSDRISDINKAFIYKICKILEIKTNISCSSEYNLIEGQTEKIINICKQLNAATYISGPAAKCYLNEELANNEGVNVEWIDYSDYPEYEQLYPPFQHSVSILDLIFNAGPFAKQYMKSFSYDNIQ